MTDMDSKKPFGTIWAALACLCLIAGGAPAKTSPAPGQAPGSQAGPVVVQTQPSGAIADRIAWARGEAKANGWGKGFWIGFGIRRLMGEHSSMGWYPWGGPEQRLTLDDLINGRKTPLEKKIADDQAARGTAASMPDAARSYAARRKTDEPERPAMRDIGILLHWSAREAEFPVDIRVSNLNLPFDLEGLPFVWAGMAADAESLAYLIPLYAKATAPDDKRSLLWAIGLHRNAPAVVPFIERVLAGKEGEEIRAEAAECLGEQNEPKALDLLLRTIKTDPSGEVRSRAVEGLVEMELPAAAEALISFALNGTDRPIRTEAVHGLAEKATEATIKALERISSGDRDPEVQEKAIHALADLPGRSGLPRLINLVKTHADPTVRKEAVDAIGDVGGAEAIKFLSEVARGRGR